MLFHHMLIISMPSCNLVSYCRNLSGPVKSLFRPFSELVTIIHQDGVVMLEVIEGFAYRGNNLRNSRWAIEGSWIGGVLPSRHSESLSRPFLTSASGLAEFRVSGKPPSTLLFCFYQNVPLSHTI
jgi:hypothetical protein